MHSYENLNITHLICSSDPPDVALLMAHAASLRVLNSPDTRMRRSGGMMFASSTAWIWLLFPAVMFEIVQHASLRRLS